MNKLITACLVVLIYNLSSAQQLQYKVLEDNPDKIYSGFIAAGIGLTFTKQYNALPLAINGRYNLGKIQLEGALNYDL